ncbi:MAG: type transport system permease protein [Solirubrobacteraceae bacterium]|jgi:ABC-2 type transport system permease protein|nr:type transport system permease protein [Solirubrobacteraceae bacterium]
MRWLLLKDLQILRRSPLLVATLVLYPVLLALLVGAATNAGPSKPKVAFVNLVPKGKSSFSIGGEKLDAAKYAKQLFKSIDPIRVKTRAEARELVASGRALGALILPPDATERLQNAINLSGSEPPTLEVLYNADNPAKERYVRSTISSRLGDANTVLSRRLTEIAANYIGVIVEGGEFSLFGQKFNVLGLRNSERIINGVIDSLPRDDPQRAALDQVSRFAKLASDNLDVSKPILASIGQPVRIKQTIVNGKSASLDSLVAPLTVTLALTFVTLLLAAGMLALEREENAFGRLVRGLVSRLSLVVEKVGLAALCSFVVCLLMLAVLAVFVDLDWGRAPLWLPALALGSLGFAGMGVAVGCLAREVRSASLLVFALSLPMAALALVPSGAVGEAPFKVVQVVNFVLPFKWALQALDAAINDAEPTLLAPALHLAGLTLAFIGIARLAMRRFA